MGPRKRHGFIEDRRWRPLVPTSPAGHACPASRVGLTYRTRSIEMMSAMQDTAVSVHEYSLIQSLVERVEAEARERNALAVRRLRVRVGELSGVEPELLATAYEMFRAGTLCAEAALDIEQVPARWACGQCGAAVASGGILQCPRCGEPAALIEGQDIILERIELEVP